MVFAGNAHDLLVRIFSAIAAKPVQILSSRQEFLSAMRQFRRWEETGDAIVTLVDAEDMVEAAATRQFDLIYLSQIFYDSGHESTWRRLATYARPEGPWVVIDGYHGFMAVPTDLGEVADRIFYIAGGYKYAMSGEGVGILHAPPDLAPAPGSQAGLPKPTRAMQHLTHRYGLPEMPAVFWAARSTHRGFTDLMQCAECCRNNR